MTKIILANLAIFVLFILAVFIEINGSSSVDKTEVDKSIDEIFEKNALKEVQVMGLDKSDFPEITASVFINRNCASSGGMREQDFSFMENGSKVDIDDFFFTGQANGQNVDLAVIFDDSSSLSAEIDALKSKVQDLIDQIAASDLDARYALVSFQDHENLRLSWTKNTASFKNAVSSLNPNAGDDVPENALDAIEAILKLGFRSDAQKMILIITDAPAHQRGDGTNFTSLTGDDVKADLLKSGVLFIVVSPVFSSYVAPNLDLKNLANEVDGTWIDIKSADFSNILDQITTMITGMYVIKYMSPDLSLNSPREVQVFFGNSSCVSGQIISGYTSPENIYENNNNRSGDQGGLWDAISKLSSLIDIASACFILLMVFLGMRRYGGWNYLRHLITPEVPNNDCRAQSAIPMVENRLRIETYTKFVELMAVRPIDMHYATYEIVPKLEAIQLISSLEVKRTAKDILDEAISSNKIICLPKFIRQINEELIPIIKNEIEDIHSAD
jgi:hypothetical protein